MQRKVSVTKRFTFEASHNLMFYVGPCSNLHGHSYKLYVTVSGYVDTVSKNVTDCMVIDFKDIKSIVKREVIDKLDHTYLNEVFTQPTAEVMAVLIFQTLENAFPKDCTLEKIRLYETEDSYAEVCRN